jgi:hypothetical protein
VAVAVVVAGMVQYPLELKQQVVQVAVVMLAQLLQ